MGDAHAKDVARLTKRVEELEPLAAVAKHNLEEKERAEADAAEWQRVGQEATAEQQRLTRALEEAEQRANEAEKEAAALGEEVEALEKKVNTLEINAKYDASARDGQVKRSRIMQAELEETREDNAKMEDRMRELERNKADLTKTVNFERAMRLQELHRNSALGNAKKKAELGETEMERRAGDISEELASSRADVRRLEATVAALERVAKHHDDEMLLVRKDHEELSKTRHHLSGRHESVVATLEASLEAQRQLEAEVSRLRQQVVTSAKERGSPGAAAQAMLAPRQGRSARKAILAATGAAAGPPKQLKLGADGDGYGGGGSGNDGWREQLALEASVNGTRGQRQGNTSSNVNTRKDNAVEEEPALLAGSGRHWRSRMPRLGGGGGGGLSGGSLGAAVGLLPRVSRSAEFMQQEQDSRHSGAQHFLQPNATTAASLAPEIGQSNKHASSVPGRVSLQEGQLGLHDLGQRRQRALAATATTSATVVGERGSVGHRRASHSRRVPLDTTGMRSQLSPTGATKDHGGPEADSVKHPGSLFVGSGLGIKKVATVATPTMAGSTRHILRNLLGNQEGE